jgi:hypothetical protein
MVWHTKLLDYNQSTIHTHGEGSLEHPLPNPPPEGEGQAHHCASFNSMIARE